MHRYVHSESGYHAGKAPNSTVDDIVSEVTGLCWFSKMGLLSVYHQILLAPESCQVTTVLTPLGLQHYKCLNFDISSVGEVFQDIIRGVLAGLFGVLNVSDDILVHAPTLNKHRAYLKAVFCSLKDSGLILHREK